MTPRGLIKLTAVANNIEAWRDWQKISDRAIAAGRYDLIEKYAPPKDASWRKVDKAIAAVKRALQEPTP